MTNDLLVAFSSFFKDNKVVLDSYRIDEGYYYLVKKNGTLEKLKVEKERPEGEELYEYFKVRDFYSKYLSSNKAIDTTYTEVIDSKKYTMLKKICSNNCYTLFFKNKSLLGMANEQAINDAVTIEVFIKGIEKYYTSLQQLGTKKEEMQLLEKGYTKEEIENSKQRMLQALDKIYEDFQNIEKPKETWVKIFLEETEEEYERVSNIYFQLKLFNTNDNNKEIDGTIFGVNNYNYGLNSKKPFLELKSTPYKVSSMISQEQITMLNRIYLWLYQNGIQQNVLKLPENWKFKGVPETEDRVENKNVYIMKVAGNNGVARIEDYTYTTNFTTKIREFVCRDYLQKISNEFRTENIYALEWYTSNVWIAQNQKSEKNYLRLSYYDYEKAIAKSMLSNWKKEFLKTYANTFLELFQKEEEKNFRKQLDKFLNEIVENMLIEELEKGKTVHHTVDAMNLYLAYQEYFNKKKEGKGMKINQIGEECAKIMQQEEKITTDEQYYYLMGQVAFYLLNRSKASKLTQDVTVPFIKASNIKRLKEEVKYLYEKYNYDIYLNDCKFNNVMSQLLLQEPESTVKQNKDIILAGMLANNIFYRKKEIGGNENGENE